MSREHFYCEPCNVSWYDDCTFWNGYLSPCPQCGENREAVIHTDFSFTDPGMMDAPLFDLAERSEEDLEAERDIIHDEIVVEVDEGDAEDVALKVERAMCAAGEEYLTTVPVKVEWQIASEWAK